MTLRLPACPGLGVARSLVARQMRHAFAEDRARPTPVAATRPHEGDPGLFGPDSVAWDVHADLSMLVGGLCALFVQLTHPLAMAGVAQHSNYRHDPLGRLGRTSEFIRATTYGTTGEAEQAIEVVRAVHERVRGTAPDGRPYAATDPALLSWVHNVEVDSFLRAFQRYGAGVDDEHADRYVFEMTRVGRRLGAVDLPTDARALHEWTLSVPELAVTPGAREAVRFLLAPPIPLVTRPAYAVIAAAAIGLVPSEHRRRLGLVTLPLVDPIAVRPATVVFLRSLRWMLGANPVRRAALARVAA